ncbi:MAG: hypothetical protein J0L58_09810, partial [Burkholderiales bacterium]|nr:hypothetical protein [Burkholderiales bacterium]
MGEDGMAGGEERLPFFQSHHDKSPAGDGPLAFLAPYLWGHASTAGGDLSRCLGACLFRIGCAGQRGVQR